MKKHAFFPVLLCIMALGYGGLAHAKEAQAQKHETTASLNAAAAARSANTTAIVAPVSETPPCEKSSDDDTAEATPAPETESAKPTSQSAATMLNLTINPDSGYRIIPGDVLQIDVWKEEGLNQEVLVLPDGMITFPLAGSFQVAGMTLESVQGIIKQKLKEFIPDATVTVSVKAALGHTVSVIGQVTKPGEFIMGHGLTGMQALAQAGGLTPYADESSVLVLRRTADGVETSIPFPYDDIVRGKTLTLDVVLQPGDVVVVPTTSLF